MEESQNLKEKIQVASRNRFCEAITYNFSVSATIGSVNFVMWLRKIDFTKPPEFFLKRIYLSGWTKTVFDPSEGGLPAKFPNNLDI